MSNYSNVRLSLVDLRWAQSYVSPVVTPDHFFQHLQIVVPHHFLQIVILDPFSLLLQIIFTNLGIVVPDLLLTANIERWFYSACRSVKGWGCNIQYIYCKTSVCWVNLFFMSVRTSCNTFVNSMRIFRNIATSTYALRVTDSILCCLLSLYLQSIQPCSPAPRSEEVALLNGFSLAGPSRCLSSWPMRARLTV